MLLIGLIEVGRLAYFTIEVGNAAHAGAEYGSLSLANAADKSGITKAAQNDGTNSISSLAVDPQVICTCWNGTVDNPNPPTSAACGQSCTTGGHQISDVQVTVTGTITSLFSFQKIGLPTSWTISRTATSYILPNQ